MKKIFIHGIVSGILAALAGMVYNYAYTAAMWVDFSAIINPASILGASLFGTLMTSAGYAVFIRWVRKNADAWFNVLLLLLSFATFVASFAFTLPLETESPELFPGLSIPLHLFPALFWLATKPLWNTKTS